MVEGTSFLVLLVFSLLKRLGSVSPEVNEIGRLGVKFVGMTHGVLLMVFLLALFQAWGNRALSGKKCLMAFVASLVPFGPFLIDRRLAESTKRQAVDSAD
jgi:integral membrane protein